MKKYNEFGEYDLKEYRGTIRELQNDKSRKL